MQEQELVSLLRRTLPHLELDLDLYREVQQALLDTTNDFLVGASADGSVCFLKTPIGPMDRSKALRLAAWLVALSETQTGEFDRVLSAVRAV